MDFYLRYEMDEPKDETRYIIERVEADGTHTELARVTYDPEHAAQFETCKTTGRYASLSWRTGEANDQEMDELDRLFNHMVVERDDWSDFAYSL